MDSNSKIKIVTLQITRKENTDLESALKDFPFDSFAVLYSPGACHLALWKNQKFITLNSKEIRAVFEARVFNETAEFRWLKDGNAGTAVMLSEDVKIGFAEKVSSAAHETINQNYLIWGQSTGKSENGWTKFGTARIGSFFVPVPNIADKGYAQFTAVEYLASEDENGNIFVADERLTGISEVK